MEAAGGPHGARKVLGLVASLLGMAVLLVLAAYWLLDAGALARSLRLQTDTADAAAMARVASAFRAGFDLFAVAVMALPLARRDWSMLGRVALLTAVCIPGADAVIWWSVLEGPTLVDVVPHALVALPLLVAAAALIPAGARSG